MNPQAVETFKIFLQATMLLTMLAILFAAWRGWFARPALPAGPPSDSFWRQAEAPFWWPDARGFAIFGIMFLCGTALYIRMGMTKATEDKILDVMITVLFTTCLTGVFSFLFGANRNSANVTDTQNKLLDRAISAATTPAVVPTTESLGEGMLSNGELKYFRALTTDEAKKAFLAMSAAERQATIAKT